jgi:hypothetical protein
METQFVPFPDSCTAVRSSYSIYLVGLGKQRPARYRCIQMCRNGMLGAPTFATRNGAAVNLTTETGESYRAWPDWNAPYSRIRIDCARRTHFKKWRRRF